MATHRFPSHIVLTRAQALDVLAVLEALDDDQVVLEPFVRLQVREAASVLVERLTTEWIGPDPD